MSSVVPREKAGIISFCGSPLPGLGWIFRAVDFNRYDGPGRAGRNAEMLLQSCCGFVCVFSSGS